MIVRIAAALVVAVLGLAACDDDGASVRDLGGSASSGSGSGSGSGSATGVASGSGTEPSTECVEDEGQSGLRVMLSEWDVEPAEEKLATGPIRFLATNKGEVDHELVIVQSPNIEALPLAENGAVDEEALRPGQLIAEVEGVPAGETCVLEVDLEPATYVLFCNVVDEGEKKERSHFLRGMRARVKVS